MDDIYAEVRLNSELPPNDPTLLQGGRWDGNRSERQFIRMKREIKKHGFRSLIDEGSRILDFGCRCGRIMRHIALSNEAWGVDVHAPSIKWCRENMDPKYNFLTNHPHYAHLPFADEYFDLIYTFSVFSHIGQNYLSWIMELRRILKNDGVIYLSIHDENTLEWSKSPSFEEKETDTHNYVTDSINSLREPLKQDYIVAYAGNKGELGNTFFQRERFQEEMKKYFTICDYIENGYNFQSVIILSKPKPI
jgi:SAM-dependent methyltransferase